MESHGTPPGSMPAISPSTSPSAPSITTTATSSSPPQALEAEPTSDSEDDFFGQTPYHPLVTEGAHTSGPSELQSDIPQLRRTHVTNGYREGLSAAKETSLQAGFDEGFPTGAAAGLKVGTVLGVLAGMVRVAKGEDREMLRNVLQQAREELRFQNLVEVLQTEQEGANEELEGTVQEEQLEMEVVGLKNDVVQRWEEKVKNLSTKRLVI